MDEELQLGVCSPPGDAHCLTDLRILLLGNKAAGKSSCVSTVLGREEANTRTAQCVRTQGRAAGRAVTAVEAPGWWSNYLLKDAPLLHGQEIQRSASLCLPGPHAVLLVLRLDTHFTEQSRRALEERVELLGGLVWNHCVVLFTYGDHLGGAAIEQHMEAEGAALQGLVEKCGNRLHIINNKSREDHQQVTELLEKVEDVAKGNGGRHFEAEPVRLRAMELRWRSAEVKAAERRKRAENRGAGAALAHQGQADLRVLVVGHRHSGKSSVGNTILGKMEFDLRRTSKCASKRGEVAGRLVSVVEAPGWWNTYRLMESPQLNQQELVRSASLCPPGPHVVLLTLRADGSFTFMNRRAIEEHLGVFGERVWNHTMVVFNYGDWLGETPIEMYIESEGESLQWLVEKCGNRYHVLENSASANGPQVTELLRKMEEVISANAGQHYEVASTVSLELQRQQAAERERARQRMAEVAEKRQCLRTLLGVTPHIPELRMVLLGWRYSGKSSAGNAILGGTHFHPERASTCERWQGRVGGRQVVLVEAPGWWRSCSVELTPDSVRQEIIWSVCLCAPGPHALLLVVQADASFTQREQKVVQEHVELLGQTVWNHTMVLFTSGDWLGDTPIEQHIESEGEPLRGLVDLCRNRYHVLNTQDTGAAHQVAQLLDKVQEMVAGNAGYFLVEVLKPPPSKARRQRGEEKDAEAEKDEEESLQTDDDQVRTEDAPAFPVPQNTWRFSDLPVRKAESLQLSRPAMGGDDHFDSLACDSGVCFSRLNLSSSALPSPASSHSSGLGSSRSCGAEPDALHAVAKRPKRERTSAEQDRA